MTAWRPIAVEPISTEDIGDLDRKTGRPGTRPKSRLLIDHNVPQAVVDRLRETWSTIVTAQELKIQGHDDEDYIKHALKFGQMIVTCDRDYLDDRRFPLHQCPGILILDLGSHSNSEQVASVFSVVELFIDYPRLYDRWAKVYIHPDSTWTEHLRFEDGSSSMSRLRLVNDKIEEWVDE